MSSIGESTLHAALLKRATERIEELEAQLAEAGAAAGPDTDALKRLGHRLRDQQAEIAERVATMSGAYQQLVSQLRTMSVSLQELAALSTAFTEALDALESATADTGKRAESGFRLDVPADRTVQPAASGSTAQEDELVDQATEDSSLAAAADALLATLADVEASLDEALEDPGLDAGRDGAAIDFLADDAVREVEEDQGSRYSRRSAKLPRIGDAAQQDALAAAKSMRDVFGDD